jgi:hypothetical protein
MSEVTPNQPADDTEENWVCFANLPDYYGLAIAQLKIENKVPIILILNASKATVGSKPRKVR